MPVRARSESGTLDSSLLHVRNDNIASGRYSSEMEGFYFISPEDAWFPVSVITMDRLGNNIRKFELRKDAFPRKTRKYIFVYL